jgi:hypothetical protein
MPNPVAQTIRATVILNVPLGQPDQRFEALNMVELL